MDSKDQNIIVLNFSDYQVPEFKEVKDSGMIKYGADNQYPEYLLSMFNRSPKHNAIINSKATYVVGKGFDNKKIDAVNTFGESAAKILRKQALDVEIFGGTYLQIIWGKAGKQIAAIIHLDYCKVRSNKDNTEFYYRETGWKNWNRGENFKTMKAFDPENPKGSQVLYYKEYRPGINTYTLPNYIGSLNYIEADMLVSEHVLNNSKSGFTPSKMISLFNGDPGDEGKKAIEKGFADKYTGKKGTKFILQFGNDPLKKAIIEDLGQSDMSKENFGPIDELIQGNIFAGHQITSPMLFGIKTAGQLGGRSELIESYEIFKNTYINAKQQNLEEVWSMLLQFRGVKKDVKIIPVDPIGIDVFTTPGLLAMVPKKWIMDKLGIDLNDYPEDKPAPAPAPADQPPADKKQEMKMEDDTLIGYFSEVGSPKDEFIVVKTKKTFFSSDEDCVIMEQMAFAEISQAEANIIDLVRKDKRITPDALATALKVPVPYVERLLSGLEDKGLLKASTETVGDDKQTIRTPTDETSAAVKETKPVTTEIFVKYSYEGPLDDRNRDFCARLLKMNRFFSRADIETISQRVGYSVWERRGGFYHNPNTGATTPFCRHKWVQNIVIKK